MKGKVLEEFKECVCESLAEFHEGYDQNDEDYPELVEGINQVIRLVKKAKSCDQAEA